MAKKGENRGPITLECTVCKKHQTRPSEKNKKNTPDKMKINKYCDVCKKHTEHIEKK